MASSPDMRLQLIIDAINRSEAAFTRVKKDLLDVQAETVAVTASSAKAGQAMTGAGNAGAAAMRGIGPSVAAARDHVAAAQKDMPALLQKFAELKAHYDTITATGTATGKSLEDAGKKGAAGMDHIHDRAQRAHSMLGQMVQMALIMGAALFAQKLTDAGVEYNKAMETSKLGLSAIMTSMGVITTQQGQVLQGQEKWNAAQQLSVQAQRDLQREGMLTAATYTELVEIYQGILAPALSAKMTFEETLDIAGLLTNAVKSIGLNTNQVKQEARDLIQGGISPASSSLAVALGITDAMVKKWREQGTLYQELKTRLNGFTYAANEFASTWEGAWSNFRDVAQRALGEGSKPLFDYIRKEVIKLTADMTNITRDASGKIIDIQVKPEVVARIRELARDLEALIRLLEITVSWAGKLAEPALMVGIAVGINKITTAVKGLALAAGSGALARLITSLPALAAVAGLWAGKQYADAKSMSEDAADVRLRAKVETDHDSARLRAMGVNPMQNIDQFGLREMEAVRKKLPTADNTDIATMLRRGIISLVKETVPGFDKEWRIKLHIDDAKAKQFLEGPAAPFSLTGPTTSNADELRKRQEAKRAGIEDDYREQVSAVKRAETEKVEAAKSGLKEKELLYKQGGMNETEYLKAQAESQKAILQASIDATIAEQKKLDEEWDKKKGTYDTAERSRAHAAYISARGKLEEDQVKKEAELKRSGTDQEIKQLEQLRALEAARREGALKLLQEQLTAERQLTRELLEREKITPAEAERRNIVTDQSALEAEYWEVAARKMVGGLGEATRAELEAQLQLLEQRMESLSQQAPSRLYKADRATDSLEAKREESRISHELAKLDEKEQMSEVGKVEALRQRLELLDQLLARQQKVQDGIDPNDTAAWLAAQAAIDGTRQKIAAGKGEAREFADDMGKGFSAGIQQYVASVGGGFKQMKALSSETAQAMQQSFSDFFFDAMQGKMKSLGDYVSSFLASVERAIANVMAQKVASSIMGADFGSLLGFRANGGDVTAGQPYVVGEKGMELFIPQRSGTIIPNHALPKSAPTPLGGTGAQFSFSQQINVDNRGNSDAQGGMDSEKVAQLGKIIHVAVTQIILNEKRPGGLLS